MKNRIAVLLDIVSIQDYIFKSNGLRENLGASFLIEDVYHKYLAGALTKITDNKLNDELKNLDLWRNSENPKHDTSKKLNYGYIGGGNALLFFEDEDCAKKFIEEWTKILLINVPGLTTAIAFCSLSEDHSQFREELDTLFEILERNKAEHIPITLLPRHGITTECNSSGVSAEIYNKLSKTYVSAGTNAKIEASNDSKNSLKKKYNSLLDNKYCFTNELELLGGVSGEDSHIAIVHIDGNDIGERFKKAETLNDLDKLSRLMKETIESAFEEVIRVMIEKYNNIMQSLGFDPNSKDSKLHYPIDVEDGKKILPIRPIILGGDDVTFVCDGKLGLFFAKIFIKAYENSKIDHSEKLTACAGVAIIKTKYPFYRGVSMANELCSNAKKVRKDPDRGDLNSSFLDFQISFGGIAAGLQQLRESFSVPRGNLLYRPFKIMPKEQFDEYSFDLFLEKAWQLKLQENDKANLPNSKINELNDVLSQSEEAARKFVQHEKLRGRDLPEIKGYQYGETLFENGRTPYHDMIEILRFYPDRRLVGENGEKQ